jgi:hypothetical protein
MSKRICGISTLLVAGFACTAALAQQQDQAQSLQRFQLLGGVSQGTLRVGNEIVPTNPYSGRVDAPIFDNTNNESSYLGSVQGQQALLMADDFSFSNSAWAGQTGRHPTKFGMILFNGGTVAGAVQCRVRFYTSAHFNYSGPNGWGVAMDDTANSFFDGVLTTGTLGPNTGNYYEANFPAAFTFPDGTDQFYATFQMVQPDGVTPATPTVSYGFGGIAQCAGATPGNAANPGLDISDYARDTNGSLVLDASATIGGASDHRQTTAGGNAAAPSFIIFYSPPLVLPTPTFDFGCLADGVTNRTTDTIAANGVAWYKFCLNGDAIDQAGVDGQFVDFWTFGSSFDTAVGIWDTAGHLLSGNPFGGFFSTDNDGTLTSSMMTFGVGRRAPVSAGGRERDGSDFWTDNATYYRGLPMVQGPYYIAVAGHGASFQPAFGISGAWAGGNISAHFETNTNGAVLAPSVAPIPEVDGGVIVAPGAQLAALAANTVDYPRWLKFNLCQATTATNTVTFDFSSCAAGSSWGWSLFDGTGHLVTNAAGAGTPANVTFDGSTPALTLASGDYYLALSFAYNAVTFATGSDRWHVRNIDISNWQDGVGVSPSWSTCPSSFCCRNDFNGDGDVGTDLDIEDFFACLGGTCCPTCPPNADFNCDGDVGTDADIESFFRVLSGGPC